WLIAGVLGSCLTVLAGCGGGAGLPQAEGTGGAFGGSGPTSGKAPGAPAQNVALTTANDRSSPGIVASGGPNAPYNYAPAVLHLGNGYRMWWCSQLPGAPRPGDQILSA